MDIYRKSVDMDIDMDGQFHIHGKPAKTMQNFKKTHKISNKRTSFNSFNLMLNAYA